MKTAPLSNQEVENSFEEMRKLLARNFGVTVVHDANGAYGRAGKTYLTLRFNKHFEATFTLRKIRSWESDEQLAKIEKATPK